MSPDVISTLDAIQPSQFTAPADRFAAKEAARRLLAALRRPLSKAGPSPSRAPALLPAVSRFKTLASGRNGQRPIDKIQAQQGRLTSF